MFFLSVGKLFLLVENNIFVGGEIVFRWLAISFWSVEKMYLSVDKFFWSGEKEFVD